VRSRHRAYANANERRVLDTKRRFIAIFLSAYPAGLLQLGSITDVMISRFCAQGAERSIGEAISEGSGIALNPTKIKSGSLMTKS
jgi:hypothetical protein